jgi:signal transduction histidine kinase
MVLAIKQWETTMRIGIRVKFSLVLAGVLLFTIIIFGVQVLNGMKENQQIVYEELLENEANTANVYFSQICLTSSTMPQEEIIKTQGNYLAEQMGIFSNSSVVIYDSVGVVTGSSSKDAVTEGFDTVLSYALSNTTAYQTEGNSLYYFTPLVMKGKQYGVVQIYYSTEDEFKFYQEMRLLFLRTGGVVFLFCFILGYLYYDNFAKGIMKLTRIADQIKHGEYKHEGVNRKDELGSLSDAMVTMGDQIKKTIEEMQEERRKLTLAVEKLTALEQQQKQFIGNVTHEFKTPLTSMKAYCDLLEMYPEDPNLILEMKKNVTLQTERLTEMVEKVLRLSELEKYDFEYKPEVLDLGLLIEKECHSLEGKARRYGVTIERKLDQVMIYADRECLSILLVNLLDNAIKYNKEDGQIRIQCSKTETNAVVEIRDTGIGIPSELKEKVFEPFFTVEKNRSRQTGGSGLGLSLVKKLVELQQGTIILKASGKEGSTFLLTFPLYNSKNESSKSLHC